MVGLNYKLKERTQREVKKVDGREGEEEEEGNMIKCSEVRFSEEGGTVINVVQGKEERNKIKKKMFNM